MRTLIQTNDKQELKSASNIALLSLLNLTFLPVIAFIFLLMKLKQFKKQSFAYYHLQFAIKLNLIAAIALILVSIIMISLGGFNSGWTWVFVITYFVFIHTVFILIAVWTLVRSWSGHKFGYKNQ
ncbi:hypothetical protein LRP52_14235 [Photobacterium sp. ZSDE20]|nr:hypothetical protein [Photobacterium sp. ZSDE20]